MAGTLPASSSSGAAATTPTPSSPPPSPGVGVGVVSKWTSEQDKLFEKVLLNWEEEESPKWEEVAALVPGKTAAEVKKHFEFLVQDVKNIEAGLISLPCYTARDALVKEQTCSSPTGVESKKTPLTSPGGLYHHQQQQQHHHANGGSGSTTPANASNASNTTGGTSSASKTKAQDQERRKGIPWTEDEHRLFLLGLEKFGKGDWRSISRNFVVSRTPTQVASHAQKYFIRLNSIHKDKRRTSIHDITSVNGDGRQQAQGPITGQAAGGGGSGSGGGNPSPTAGAAVGQPYTPVGPAVGTPVVPINQPVPVHHHGGYPAGARSRPVPGTPLNVAHMAYPMPQPAMHH